MNTTTERRREDRDKHVQPPAADGREPPHDLGAEQACLSASMLDTAALDALREFLRPEHFYSEAHRRIFEACCTLHDEEKAVDSVSVASWLKNRDRLQQIGGVQYIANMLSAAPALSRSHVIGYGRTVFDKARVRALILTCQQFSATGYVDYGNADDFLREAERAIGRVTEVHGVDKPERIVHPVKRVYDTIAHAQSANIASGLPTGLRDLDQHTAGMMGGEVWILAAGTGVGKTASAGSMALNVAKTPPELFGSKASLCGVAIFSMEMTKEELSERFLSAESGVDFSAIRRRRLTPDQWRDLAAGASRLASLPIELDASPRLEVSVLRAKARSIRERMRRGDYAGGAKVDLSLIVVDYLQLLRNKLDRTIKSREQEVSSVARELKAIGKELGVPILALAQINRDSEKEKKRRPQLSDLRESAEIEMSASLVLFLYRPEHVGEAVNQGEEGKTEVIVAKGRNCPTTTLFARYRSHCVRLENW